MSNQIGHFRFPEHPDEPPGMEVTQPGNTPDAGRDPGPIGQESIEQRSTDQGNPAFSGTKISAGVVAVTLSLLALSLAPFYRLIEHAQSVPEACSGLHGSDYKTCVEENSQSGAAAHLHWNAWGSWFSWPAIVLFLVVAAVVAFKAVFSKSEKIVLPRQIRLGLILADLLFLVSVFHIPHDNAGRAWGLWLSLVCVIAINVGILLATTEVAEWIAERWPKRAKSTVTAPHPPEQPHLRQQSDYRPTPPAMPAGPRQPNWPPPVSPPPRGEQQFPPNDRR